MRSHPGLVFACIIAAAACEPRAQDADVKAVATDANADAKDADAERPGEVEESANFATPTIEPPPAPEGSIVLPKPWLYVQTCAEAHPCPDLEQPAGDAHCRELRLGGHDSWRLPSKDEVPRFKGVEGLEHTAGYHWTRTPYEEDFKQAWIVEPEDPASAPSTTIPRDRKPFRIRCVKEP